MFKRRICYVRCRQRLRLFAGFVRPIILEPTCTIVFPEWVKRAIALLGSTGHDGTSGIGTLIADGTIYKVDAIKEVNHYVRVCGVCIHVGVCVRVCVRAYAFSNRRYQSRTFFSYHGRRSNHQVPLPQVAPPPSSCPA